MNIYEIPLQPTPQNIKITILGVSYGVRTYYCSTETGGWVIDISDSSGNPIVQGVPMVTGTDLLGQYKYLGLGFSLLVATDSDLTAPPTFDNLGINGHLYVVV